ncbi:hypothetical protein VNO80_28842 [Phaseolus coccineus]|uniref:Uncharacterized protein n=1 Tax=Phaseolus coccineus TaxID=3886 RepID=A0AAN9L9T8_PHACN
MAFSLYQPFTLVSTILLLLLLLNSSLCESFHGFSRYGARISGDGSSRHLSESRNTQHPNNCGELVAQSQCSRNSKCSWCTSEDLDDMCFSKSEAWRLPQQVYSCALIRLYEILDCTAFETELNGLTDDNGWIGDDKIELYLEIKANSTEPLLEQRLVKPNTYKPPTPILYYLLKRFIQ